VLSNLTLTQCRGVLKCACSRPVLFFPHCDFARATFILVVFILATFYSIPIPRDVVSTRSLVETCLMIWVSRSPFCAFFLSLGFSLLGQPYFAEAGKVNITIDDTDSSITYEPTTAWFSSGNASGCAVCLTPPSVALQNNTWHQGLHIPPTSSVNGTDSASRRKRSDASTGGTSKRRNDLSNERRAPPDPPRDVPVSVQLNFTGLSRFFTNDRP